MGFEWTQLLFCFIIIIVCIQLLDIVLNHKLFQLILCST